MKKRKAKRITSVCPPDPNCRTDTSLRFTFEELGSLADRLASWHGRESLVVSVYGGWGTGKTSVKNMVVERLKERATEGALHGKSLPFR